MIKTSNLKGLRAMEVFEVTKRIDKRLRACDLPGLKLEKSYTTGYKPAFEAFDAALVPARKTGLTHPLLEADEQRDKATVGFNAYLRAMDLSPEAEKAEAARRIRLITEKYGSGLQNLSLREQTAATVNLLQELSGKEAKADLNSIGAQAWLEPLRQANAEVERLMEQRSEQMAVVETGRTRATRQALQEALTEICERINALALIEGEEKYRELMENINQIVAEARNIVKQRAAQARTKK